VVGGWGAGGGGGGDVLSVVGAFFWEFEITLLTH